MGHHFHRSTGPLGPIDGLHVIRAAGNCAEPLFDDGRTPRYGRRGKNAIHCKDGFAFSVIAGPSYYKCWPRPGFPASVYVEGEFVDIDVPLGYRGPFTAFEVGYPSARPEPWDQWREYAAANDWTFTYNYVPYAMVRALVELHGGIARMGYGLQRQPSPPPPVETFTCPACDRTSWNPGDIANRYCGACEWYTGVPELAAQRPELFTQYSRLPPQNPWDHDHDDRGACTDR